MTTEVVLCGAARTPVGTFGGSLKTVPAVRLGEIVVREALKRASAKTANVEEVIFGCVLQAGLGQNIARQVCLGASIPEAIPAMTVNKVCGSGLRTVMAAAQAIKAQDAKLVVAGGTENMSQAPFAAPKARWGARMGDAQFLDLMIHDGLWEIFNGYHMGLTAENIAEKYDISREAQDRFAFESQQKAKTAIQQGRFKDEIVAVSISQGKGEPKLFDTDEHPRETSLDKMASLKPAFKPDGSVTAGNASGINDGAAALIVADRAQADKLGLKIQARIRAYASAGVDPKFMGLGPIPATRLALEKAGLTIADLDLIELNEAFASQSLAVIKDLSLPKDIINVNGGAIALGHPIGASGARILTSLLYEMEKRDCRTGLATLCIGGGQGCALIVERAK